MTDQERGALIEAIGTALSGRWDTEGWHNESDPWTDGEVALEVIAERGCAVVTIAAPPPTPNGPDPGMPEKRGTPPPPPRPEQWTTHRHQAPDGEVYLCAMGCAGDTWFVPPRARLAGHRLPVSHGARRNRLPTGRPERAQRVRRYGDGGRRPRRVPRSQGGATVTTQTARFLLCDCDHCPSSGGEACAAEQGPAKAVGILRLNAERHGWLVGRVDLCPACRTAEHRKEHG